MADRVYHGDARAGQPGATAAAGGRRPGTAVPRRAVPLAQPVGNAARRSASGDS
ncbi:hypothetical protein [Sorangium cellulosum]|uniref:hypothetical protein n=1 Tax=Sorangium cellulosum TaxID=56 RepID=UPI0013316703|nr:hypothetical protein [Sorangium cellulosum]